MESLIIAFNKLNNKLNKTVFQSDIETIVKDIIEDAESNRNPETIRDLFTLIFHKRNCHIGGEGYRNVSYLLLLEVYKYYPKTVCSLIELLPLYGCYKDYFEIWKAICKMELTDYERYETYNPLIMSIVAKIKNQLTNDAKEETISLLAKWMPREGTHYDKQCFWYSSQPIQNTKPIPIFNLVFYLAHIINGRLPQNITKKSTNMVFMKYRKLISSLTKKLNIPEVLMCANKYSEIEFEKVYFKAMVNYTKSFLNEKSFNIIDKEYWKARGHLEYPPIPPTIEQLEHPGDRFPEKYDRITARNNLINQIKEGTLKLNGKHIYLERIIECMNGEITTKSIKEVLKLEWKLKKQSIINANESYQSINLFNCIPMIDISTSMYLENYSMNHTNINVALGYGLMATELQHQEQLQYAISFTNPPTIINFDNDDDFEARQDKIFKVSSSTPENKKINYATQFNKAIELILEVCIKNKIENDDIPNLFVMTDNHFDIMNMDLDETNPNTNIKTNPNPEQKWKDVYQVLKTKWMEAGYDRVPTINYWNLSYDGNNKPTITEDREYPGIKMIRGFSHLMSKYILYGNEEFITPSDPIEKFRKAIDQEIYKPIYQTVINSTEKLLNYKYNF